MIALAEPKQVEPGIYYDVSFDEYKSWPGYNPSLVKIILHESALAMRHTMTEGGAESSDSMDTGTAAHLLVSNPDLFNASYVIWEGAVRRGKAWDQFCEEHDGKQIITAAQYEAVVKIRDSIRQHKFAKELLGGNGRWEVSVAWIDPVTGAPCKGRIDFLKDLGIVDLKTAADPKPRAFISQVVKYGYHISMSAYLSGLNALGHMAEDAHFIAVGNKPWHDVVCYRLPPSVIRIGMSRWEYGLSLALECERLGKWPGYSAEPIEIELPDWAMGKVADAITVGGESVFEQEEV